MAVVKKHERVPSSPLKFSTLPASIQQKRNSSRPHGKYCGASCVHYNTITHERKRTS